MRILFAKSSEGAKELSGLCAFLLDIKLRYCLICDRNQAIPQKLNTVDAIASKAVSKSSLTI